tara:strand:- start:2102 stop:2251 length:150 start_codon:yes stop_codon:yes gene_type:complete
MDEILNNLQVGDVIYTTRNGVDYIFIARNENRKVKVKFLLPFRFVEEEE